MSRISVDMLASILKYMDIEYMTDEECDSIYDLDINDGEDQEAVIERVIIPGLVREYEKNEFKEFREIILLGLNKVKERNIEFKSRSFPFKNELQDQEAFLRKIYNKLLEEEKED